MSRSTTKRRTLLVRRQAGPKLRLALGGAILAIACGCRDDESATGPVCYPVQGELRIDGRPAQGAMLKFLPATGAAQGQMPTALVDEAGRWTASYSQAGDGAPAGEYRVLVVWMELAPEGCLAFDRLGGRYCDPDHPVASIVVRAGENYIGPIGIHTQNEPP